MSALLVTGATGEVARGVVPFLDKEFELRLLSLDPPGKDPRYIQGDILDWDGLARAMDGVDAVLHLAIAPGHSGTYERDAVNDLRFDINVRGTYHVFETARRFRIPRVVHVSSVMATWGHALARGKKKKLPLILGDAPPFPVGTYSLTKALGEDIARYYALNIDVAKSIAPPGDGHPDRDLALSPHPMSVITLRIGAPLDLDDPHLKKKSVRPQQVPYPDLAQAFILALTAKLKDYQIVTIVGQSSHTAWDLEPARRILGYRPRFNLDELGLNFAKDPFYVEAK